MEEREATPQTPERPILGSHPQSAKEAEPEPYGREYYSLNMAHKLASSKPDHTKISHSRSHGGWALPLLIVAAALYFYLNPHIIISSLGKWKEWILAQQQDVFSRGGGYGTLPQSDH
jgi:hypothetical protein